uniref:Uncharacterized protein n=1 Tax=Candidatus Kentrum sp. UNK TaxID=2126344 RepID=A0A451B0F5_9GAMM|nr:MAG: hypothetical protein BECKUNK1418G_GA0071005_10806 [Candidatus Kentron sp. UNK]VFK71749.1 MAG: hypothetical protein BECKUNK1418H_GA0071006_10816 [Candidatus Kentron sp. UNK]
MIDDKVEIQKATPPDVTPSDHTKEPQAEVEVPQQLASSSIGEDGISTKTSQSTPPEAAPSVHKEPESKAQSTQKSDSSSVHEDGTNTETFKDTPPSEAVPSDSKKQSKADPKKPLQPPCVSSFN